MIPHPQPVRLSGPSRRQLLAAAGLTAFVPTLAACTGDRDAAVRSGTDQVTGLTSFGNLGRDAYWHVAAAKGFFADEHLEVAVEPGAGTKDNLAVLGTQAQFAAIDLSGALITYGEGNTTHVVLAAVHQLAPAALMTTNPDIRNPRDLAGRTVGMAPGAVLQLLFPEYAAQFGLDRPRWTSSGYGRTS